jgi:hypothetical protein
MDGATDLSELMGSGPVQNPSLPQSTTFSPIVTGGTDPFVTNGMTMGNQNKPAAQLYSQAQTFSTVRYAVKNLMTYFGFFLAAMIISLSTPRSLILQYIPNTYTAGGVPSYMGAAILAGVAVAVGYVVSTLGSSLI